ncbi:DUF1523 family protein [Paroceanicella profunda]|uniref:DUF1523 family protein n=1 Tax=Paroceanicella profunda TaxID=2579971 RepID=A0A5B8FYJ1_9RHOB|nr:DUF1523 family protein [Paroceanicella profunda]QDL91622.1 DUF1523 family protein [Paroceanicella profunda]
MLRRLKWILIAVAVLFVGAWFHYYLPSHEVVRVVGTDTKRVDGSGLFDSTRTNSQSTQTRDVRFINTVGQNGKEYVFRNEDTGWSFPFYFKFDSGTLQARAQSEVSGRDTPQWVVVTSYGWRLEMLTMFPNVIDIEPTDTADPTIVPWFNIIFFVVLGLLAFWVFRLVRRFKRRRIDPIFDGDPDT